MWLLVFGLVYCHMAQGIPSAESHYAVIFQTSNIKNCGWVSCIPMRIFFLFIAEHIPEHQFLEILPEFIQLGFVVHCYHCQLVE